MRNIVKSVLDAQNWKYLESDGVFKLDVEGESSAWSSFLRVEDDDSLSYYAVLPAKVDEDKLTLMTELLARLNFILKVGSFEINLNDGASRGQIMFKTYAVTSQSLAETAPKVAEELVSKAIAFNMLTMDHYAVQLMKAIYSETFTVEQFFSNNERGEQI